MELSVDAREITALAKRFEAQPRKIRRKMRKIAIQADKELHDSLVRHASGRPGPNVVTGAYISNFYTDVAIGVDQIVIIGGNPSPQSARLEYGFYGVDSAGRNYSQPPYPHFRPALIETQQWLLDQMRQLLGDELE